jgi:hypothetical protein
MPLDTPPVADLVAVEPVLVVRVRVEFAGEEAQMDRIFVVGMVTHCSNTPNQSLLLVKLWGVGDKVRTRPTGIRRPTRFELLKIPFDVFLLGAHVFHFLSSRSAASIASRSVGLVFHPVTRLMHTEYDCGSSVSVVSAMTFAPVRSSQSIRCASVIVGCVEAASGHELLL